MAGGHVFSYLLLSLLVVVYGNVALQQTSCEIESVERYIANAVKNVSSRYRLLYHISPQVGWMNDPNGMSYYNGLYHMFYQYYPYDSVWGPMHWGHVASPDLVNWSHLPVALVPEEEWCYSGSAIEIDGEHVLMYTANIPLLPDNSIYIEKQYLAFSSDGVTYTKYGGNPVINNSINWSPDFRDPKVWKHGDYYYTVIGNKFFVGDEQRGGTLIYRSLDMFEWEYLNTISSNNGTFGYMWECPDFFELDGKFIFLFSPQGLQPQGDRYHNVYPTGYIVGSFDYDTNVFTEEVPLQELDYGHDFYATQTMEVDGKRILAAWFSSWEVDHPEDDDGWAGALTIMREISLDSNNRLLMKPIEALKTLRDCEILGGTFECNQEQGFGKAAEIIITNCFEERVDLLFEGYEGGESAHLIWDPEVQKVIVDRITGNKTTTSVRQVEWAHEGSQQWRIFLDTCSIELFCGDGEVVFSTRVFPLGGWKVTNLSNQALEIESYELKQSI